MLQGLASTTCPSGYTPVRRGVTSTHPQAQGKVTWKELRRLGWALPESRPTKTNYATSGLFNSTEFYSIMCNGFKEVTADRQGCSNANSGAYGATHIRYNCTTGK